MPRRCSGTSGRPVGDDRRRQPGGRAGNWRDDVLQDRPTRDHRSPAGLRQVARHAVGNPCPPPGSRTRPQEDQGPLGALKVESLGDLRAAAEAGTIAKQKGFGAKTEANILEGIAFLEKTGERILLSEALLWSRRSSIGSRSSQGDPAPKFAAACGGGPRPSVIWTSSSVPTTPLRARRFVKLPQVARVLAHGATKASVLLPGSGRPVRPVRPAGRGRPPVSLCASLFHGIEGAQYRDSQAGDGRGAYSLNEYALTGDDGDGPAAGPRPNCSRRSGWRKFLPELREDAGEIEAAEQGTLPSLVTTEDLPGTFHCHTD